MLRFSLLSLTLVLLFFAAGSTAQGQSTPVNAYDFSNFVGQPGTTGSADGTGSDARFNYPRGVAVDSTGNAYIADYYNNTIRKITPAGAVTTLAGSPGTVGSTDGTGSAARFERPYGIAADSTGNVYVACLNGLNGLIGTIRKITPAGVVTTLAGAAAGFLSPSGIVADGSGNLFVTDSYYNTIRKITLSTGAITTVAGKSGTSGFLDAQGTAAIFFKPSGVAVDGAGNLYVTDNQYSLIRKVTPAGAVTTIAGTAGSGNVDGTGAEAKFNLPFGIAIDGAGNLYVADQGNHTIRRLSLSGASWVVTTLAGSAGTSGTADGAGSAARFNQPQGVAINSAGTLFVADMGNQRITKGAPTHLYIPPTITTAALLPSGTVGATYSQTLAATGGTTPYAWTLVSGSSLPPGLALSTGGIISGTLGALPTANFTVRVTGGDSTTAERIFTIDAPPTITTASPLPSGMVGTMYTGQQLAATGGATPYTWSLESGSSMPPGMNLNTSNGYIYGTPTLATNTPFVVRVTSSSGLFSTKSLTLTVIPVIASPSQLPAGTVGAAYSQTLAATGGTAPYTWALVSGSSLPPGWSLTSGGVLTGAPGDGTTLSFTARVDDKNGTFTSKSFTVSFQPFAPAILTGSILPSGTVGTPYNQTLAAYGGITPHGWAVTSGSLPSGLSLNSNGVLSGTPNTETTARFTVQVTPSNGLMATKAFRLTTKPPPVASDLYAFANFVGLPGTAGSADGLGSEARLNYPSGMVFDSAGNLLVMDATSHTIRKVTPAGAVTTFAGMAGISGSTDGTVSEARFSYPRGAALDNAGNLLVTEQGNETIRKITPAGMVTTLAGSPGLSGKTDSTGAEARFYDPQGAALDGGGNLYVADSYTHTIRKVTPAGVVTTVAGNLGLAGRTDGTGTAARFNYPMDVTVDSAGNLFVADWGNSAIRKVTPAGVVTTLAGSSTWLSGSDDGTGSAARFFRPCGLTVDSTGNLFVSDTSNYTIRKVTPAGVVTTIGGSAGVSGSTDGTGAAARFSQTYGIAMDGEGVLYVADPWNYRISKGTPLYAQPLITKANPLLDGMVGRVYHQALTAKGGTAPYTWSVVSGTDSLPSGLSLSGDGILTGTPNTATTTAAAFTVQVTDSSALSATKIFNLTVNPPLTITTSTALPSGAVGATYSQTLTAGGGTTFYTWSIVSGTLPLGLRLGGDGTITGTPDSAQTTQFTAQVTDVDGPSVTKVFSLAINPPPTITTASPLPAGGIGEAYHQTLTAAGGATPYAWSIVPGYGSLPQGLSLTSGGVITGTPGAKTTTGFRVQVVSSDTLSSTQDFSLSIHLRGDINDDSHVNMSDAILAMQVMCGMIPAASVHPSAAVIGDSAIGLPEAIYILQKAAGVR
jgi:sugar lactone lactonase YvrE